MNIYLSRLVRWAGIALLIAALLLPASAAQTKQDETAGGRLVLLSKLDGPPLPSTLIVLEDYGEAFVLARVSDAQLAALPQANVMDSLADRTLLSLNGAVWDTRQGEPAIPDNLRSAPDDPYFLIQFYAPVKNEWVSGLEALGVTFLGYHPNYTYIVRMDPALLDRVRATHAVQWVGRYHPFYRLAPEEDLAKAEIAADGRLVLEVRGFPDGSTPALEAELERAGASVWLSEQIGPPVVRIQAAPELLPRLAALPGVARVEAYDEPREVNDKVVQTTHTWDVWKAGRNGQLQDLMGAGQTAGSVDSGLDNKSTSPTIEDFYDYTGGATTSRVVYNANSAACGSSCTATDTDGHGTHTSGSIVGNGYNSLAQRGLTAFATAADPSFDYAWGVGMAPEARFAMIHAGSTSGGILTLPATDWVTLYNQGARSVNNSWGNSTYSYSGNSITADNVMWVRQDHLIVVAAGNSGPNTSQISQPANAKNILTVGGSVNHRSVLGVYLQYADTTTLLAPYSALGPVATSGDTRFKPDIVAPGAMVLSTRTNQVAATSAVGWGNDGGMDGGDGDGDNDGRPDYAYNGGTSMSAPQVTGAATIVRDYFQDVQGFAAATPPSAALIKAALVNGAVDMGSGYESNTSVPYGGRNMQGWGYLNVEQAIIPRAPRSFFFDDFTNITDSAHQSTMGSNGTGDYAEYTVQVVDGSEPLKITATWTDRQNGSDDYSVNDFNLLVTSPTGALYRGNHFTGSWSNTSTTAYDAVNNTEAAYIQNPGTGTWTIRLTDATHSTSVQPFALFVSGGLGTNPTWTRTCSGMAGTCANARGGTSGQTFGGTAVNYSPSLKPLRQAAEHVSAGIPTTAEFRLTNWGRSSDTIGLSYTVTDRTGAAASGVTLDFSPAGPFSLASGATQDVEATVTVADGVADGAYDLLVTATSAGAGGRRDAIVIPLNIVDGEDVSNQAPAVSLDGPQVTSDFWASGSTLWAAYLSGESHINGNGEVYASCSTDGGVTWTTVGQVDAGDRLLYYKPVIAGNPAGTSVTVVWIRPHLGVYARTWTGSGCTGAWRGIVTLASYAADVNRRVKYPDVIYDTGGRILATWQMVTSTSSSTEGIFSAYSTNDGVSYSAAAGVPAASGTDATHNMGQLALDTARNEVWMAYQNSANSGAIYLKRWVAGAWDAAGTRNPVIASSADVETRPGVGYISATASLWVTWHRYSYTAVASTAQARLYYVRSTGTLPDPTWGTTYQYPANVRTAEDYPAMVAGDGAASYIIYEAQSDDMRGGNLYALVAPAAGGAPANTCRVSATVDDPPLYARGNAGSPALQWATTTVNGTTISGGPAVLYSKNHPHNGDADYDANLGVAQTLYNLEENFDLYLAQVCEAGPTAVVLTRFEAWPLGSAIHVEWETSTETDNAGFNLYRSDTIDGEYARLNDTLIPSQAPGSPEGAVYTWTDAQVQAGATYYYRLEDVDLDGNRTPHGPVAATAAYAAYLPLLIR